MRGRQLTTADEARAIGVRLGLDWAKVSLEQFRRGIEVELEHGARDPETDITHDDLALTGRIAWAHLKRIRDTYTRLDRLEAEAHAEKTGTAAPIPPARRRLTGPAPTAWLLHSPVVPAGNSPGCATVPGMPTRTSAGARRTRARPQAGDLFSLLIEG